MTLPSISCTMASTVPPLAKPRALANGARWNLGQWGEEVGDSRAKELVCQMLGRNRDFSRISGPHLPNESSLAVLGLMLSSWPEKWPHWDGPLVGMMRILHSITAHYMAIFLR